MPNSWRQVYIELTDFIAEHPEVEIGASVVSIPESVRPEFYRLFDTVRTTFIEEKFPNLLNEATALSENYIKGEQEATELLGLEDVLMVASLHRFLHNPNDRLTRELLDPLFDLLKGKVDIETFEEEVASDIETTLRDLYQSGYEKWVALSLVKLLEADRSLMVNVPRLSPDLGGHDEQYIEPTVPMPQGLKYLSFDHERELFAVPDFIVHSPKVNGYIALRSEMDKVIATASDASEEREWYSLNSIAALEPGLTLVYVADNPDELSLVADAKKVCRPDLIIECKEQKNWYENEGLETVKLDNDMLKPRLGTYIVSRESVPEQAYKELVPEQVSKEPASEQEQKPTQQQEPEKQGSEIHILTAGFDQSKLEPIISTLMAQENKDQLLFGK